jgi:hypothetical protein
MSHKIIKGFSIERTKQKENLKKERKISKNAEENHNRNLHSNHVLFLGWSTWG